MFKNHPLGTCWNFKHPRQLLLHLHHPVPHPLFLSRKHLLTWTHPPSSPSPCPCITAFISQRDACSSVLSILLSLVSPPPSRPSLTRAQFSLVAQSCPTLCNPLDCSTSGLPVCHQLLEFTQTHVHRVGDAIQPSHPLSSPSPPALNLSQHQGLFQ